MYRRWVQIFTAVAFVCVFSTVLTTPAHAQIPGTEELLEGIKKIITDALNEFLVLIREMLVGMLNEFLNRFVNMGPGALLKILSSIVGALAWLLWNWFGGILTLNFFTQIPPGLSYELPVVGDMLNRIIPIGRLLLLLSLVLSVLSIAVGVLRGNPFGTILNSIPNYFLCLGGLVFGLQLQRWWLDFCNALSGAFLNPNTGLPGIGDFSGFDYIASLGAVAIVYIVVGVFLAWHRVQLIVLAVMLMIITPLALAAGAFPFQKAQAFFQWWLSHLLAVTFVQVLQAITLGVGAAMLSSPFITGRYEGPIQAMLNAGIGIAAILATLKLPSMLLGSLRGRNFNFGSVMQYAINVATIVAGVGAFRAVAAGRAAANAASGIGRGASGFGYGAAGMGGSGYVGSLLGRSVPLLPPPAP